MKLVSVVIPCYNVEKYIDRCVNSLVNQTLGVDNMELIFVNDASTDSTYDKLCQWEAKYPDSILVINCEQNGKQGTARNIGIRYAGTDYIGFVDSDDWVEPEMYEKMYDKAVSMNVDVVGVMYNRVTEMGETRFNDNMPYSGKLNVLCEAGEGYFRGLPGGVWGGLYRRSLIIDNDIWFPEGLAYEDNYWGGILNYYVKSWYIISEPLYDYFLNPNSTSIEHGAAHHFDRLQIEKLKLDELKRRGFYEKDKDYIDFIFLQLYYLNTIHIIVTRMETCPYDLLCQMQREVCELVPDFENNAYWSEFNEWQQALISTSRIDMTEGDWEFIFDAYLKALSQSQ